MSSPSAGTGVSAPPPPASAVSEAALVESEFGAPLEHLYKIAVKFYKENEKSGEHVLSYEDRTKLMAYSKQVRCGPYTEEQSDVGWLDFTGGDRQRAWRELGALSRGEAMAGFVFLVDRVCPPFKQFVHAERRLKGSDEPVPLGVRGIKEDTPEEDECTRISPTFQPPPVDFQIYEAQRKQIQEALNAQTFSQFHAYAQQQLPGQPEQQEALIKQLQEQHYQQYMAQVYAQQSGMQAGGAGGQGGGGGAGGGQQGQPVTKLALVDEADARARDDDSDVSDEEPGDDLPSNPAIAPASLWNRQDIVEFKGAIRKEGSDGVIKVGHGETVTVRVPTHEEGSCLFWEFATDHYDIGFGVLFEWTIAESNQVSVHVSESSDEEGEDELEGVEGAEGQRGPGEGDVEGGPREGRRRDPNKPHQDEIIPVYRRDSHEEVYAGSHVYPGRGVYLLKFDNSYSLWRSKTLYYRVYYSK